MKDNKKKLYICAIAGSLLVVSSLILIKSKNTTDASKNQHEHEKGESKESGDHKGEHKEDNKDKHKSGNKENHAEKKEIKLTADQLKRFDIQTLILTKNHFQHRLTFPGQITFNENKVTHIVASVSGSVKEIFKGLGESTKVGEALATLQSREMAGAKSAYISAHRNLALKKDLFERSEKLWKKKIKSEVDFIQARNIYEDAKIELEQDKQKLLALSMTEVQIKNLPEQKTPLNIYTIDSPIEGKIIERHVTLGEVISSDKQVFVVANLDTVWVNLAIPADDLMKIKKDQKVDIFANKGELICSGNIMYVSPVINDESRTGRAVIQLENPKNEIHPGDFIKAQVVTSENSALLSLPSSAVHRMDGKFVVFTKSKENTFEAKVINIKGSDKGEFIEIIDGLKERDEIVIKNTFFLKAELGKSEAEHSH